MTAAGDDIPFCSALSQAADEPLIGSATQVSAWFLLEVDAAWGRKATDENDLPPVVQAHLRAHLDAVPGARAQLIKQTPRPERRSIAFFVAAPPALYAFRLADYENLTALDLTAMVAGGAAFDRYRSDERLLIVCTNGKRDACCARFGRETYDALSRLGGESVWQTTHLGGHRFAANVVCLPDGLMYGRVSAESAAPLLDACRAGRIDLGHFRGRAAYGEGAQIAEHLLRERTGLDGADALRLVSEEAQGERRWAVTFEEIGAGRTHRLVVAAEATGAAVPHSCGDEKLSPVYRYYAVTAESE